ncbi:MAG TPA: RNase H family protein [Gemmataceae bacterium]|nr:RNase H family protein [Gemmataceae bacterium]
MAKIIEVYTDGGCIGPNPSTSGGTWAWCTVGEDGARVRHDSGVITPEEIGLPVVTNNVAELAAAVNAMEWLPYEWAGTICTDSRCTMLRLSKALAGSKQAKLNGVPAKLVGRLAAAKARLGACRVVLLGGHPTRLDLARGRTCAGAPVSHHNAFVDRLCREQARRFLATGAASP